MLSAYSLLQKNFFAELNETIFFVDLLLACRCTVNVVDIILYTHYDFCCIPQQVIKEF